MFSVALIGPDGAGKSTVSRALVEWSRVPCKAIYMGDNLEACNFALPTSHLVRYLRRRRKHGSVEEPADETPLTSGNRKVPLGTNTVVRVPAGQFSGRRVVPAMVVLELPGAWEHRFIMIDTSFSTLLWTESTATYGL
jgi:hypothetical protein